MLVQSGVTLDCTVRYADFLGCAGNKAKSQTVIYVSILNETTMKYPSILLIALIATPIFTLGKAPEINRVHSFGENPGNLRMHTYIPKNVRVNAPVVFVLHGCTQTAREVHKQTEWFKLADLHGFYVVYPEQKFINNVGRCFNWYTKRDIVRDKGEAHSIDQMRKYMESNYSINSDKVFVTGLSAGGAMSTTMMAVYPGNFEAAAVHSGGPYAAATNLWVGMVAMKGCVFKSPKGWGDLVREQNPNYKGSYGRMVIFHGDKDLVVFRNVASNLTKQWANIHGIEYKNRERTDRFNGNKHIRKYAYLNANGEEVIVKYELRRMGHKLAIDPGPLPTQGGKNGLFSKKKKKFWSTYWSAEFFGIVDG